MTYPPQNNGYPPAGYGHAAQPQPQAAPGGLPTIHMPDEAAIAAAYQKAQEAQARAAAIRSGQGFGNDARFFQPLGPGGQTKWSGADVPIGYEASYVIWMMPSWAAGGMPYVEDKSHFYRPADKPQGAGITCVGNGCWVCAARNMMFKTGNEADAKRAQDNGRVSRRALYQILLLEHPQSHIDAEGKMTPWIFRAPGGLHDTIVQKLRDKTAIRILDPQHGRPLILRKKKTGAQRFDIEWSIDDLDPQPLDPWYYPAYNNLWDLSKFVKTPTLSDQMQAIQAMGFPVPQELPALVAQEAAASQAVPGGAPQMAGQAAYNPNPAAPHGSPYPGQPQPSPQGYGQPAAPGAPMGAPPVPAGAPGAAPNYGAASQPYWPQGQPVPGQPAHPMGTQPPAYAPQPGAPGGYQPGAPQPQQGGYATPAPAPGVPPHLAHLQTQMKG